MSLFQKRHYEWLASELRSLDLPASTIQLFANSLAIDNPRFDRERFCAAAGVYKDRVKLLLQQRREAGAI